eukprot:364162-Pyramimonas_sp.AAC.1
MVDSGHESRRRRRIRERAGVASRTRQRLETHALARLSRAAAVSRTARSQGNLAMRRKGTLPCVAGELCHAPQGNPAMRRRGTLPCTEMHRNAVVTPAPCCR